MLAGNADRERGADVLKAAYAEGRLTKEEYDYRLGRAVSARTVEELQQLTGDVPNGPSAIPPSYQRPYSQGQLVPQQWQPALPVAPPRRQNGAATASLICGIVAPVLWGLGAVPALILGYKARAEIRRTGEEGAGAATAGIILGWTWLVLGGLMVFFAL